MNELETFNELCFLCDKHSYVPHIRVWHPANRDPLIPAKVGIYVTHKGNSISRADQQIPDYPSLDVLAEQVLGDLDRKGFFYEPPEYETPQSD